MTCRKHLPLFIYLDCFLLVYLDCFLFIYLDCSTRAFIHNLVTAINQPAKQLWTANWAQGVGAVGRSLCWHILWTNVRKMFCALMFFPLSSFSRLSLSYSLLQVYLLLPSLVSSYASPMPFILSLSLVFHLSSLSLFHLLSSSLFLSSLFSLSPFCIPSLSSSHLYLLLLVSISHIPISSHFRSLFVSHCHILLILYLTLILSLSLSACLPCCNHTAPLHCLPWPPSGCALLTLCTDPCQAVQRRHRNWSANYWCNPRRWTMSTGTTWSLRSPSTCATNTTRTEAKQKRLRKIRRSTSYPFPHCHIVIYLASAMTISPWRSSQFCRILLRPPWHHPLQLRLAQNAIQQRRQHRVKYCACSITRNTTSMDVPSGCRLHTPIARLPWRHST